MALRGTMRPAVSISGSVKKASGGGGNVSFATDETLSFVGGVLSVNVTDQVEEGNTLPVSSAAVYAAIDPAVDAALAEAKESGEFDGAPGKTAYQYAQEDGFTGTEEEFAEKLAKEHPKKISELENDSKFITASGAPVQSVNGKTGAVTLNADDVGARADDWMPTAAEVGARADDWMPTAAEVGALPDTYTPPNQTAEQVGADPSGTAAGKVAAHNTNTGAHSDIRLLISTLTSRLDALANSDDTTLDQMAEVVAYIKDNRELIEQITTGKVSVTDIVNNLTTNVSNKPLSAAQGVVIKALIDGLSSGKLDASKLTEAINTALAQAKASGEFDGKNGTSVAVSSVSESTADGGNNVVTFSDGKTLTVKNGKQGNPGTPGSDGHDGKTPVRGEDYWNPSDKAEIEAYIATELAKRGQLEPEFANSIAECTDTSKLYVLPDGFIYAYVYSEAVYDCKNWIPYSVDTDGSIYNGIGYKVGQRINSSGVIKEGESQYALTGFIPFKYGDIAHISADVFSGNGGSCAIAPFNNSKNFISNGSFYANSSGGSISTDSNGNYVFDPRLATTGSSLWQNAAFIRITASASGINSNSVVTVNEEIGVKPDNNTGSGGGYAWTTTGHAFVPADYEDRILALENKATAQDTKNADFEERISAVEKYDIAGLPDYAIAERDSVRDALYEKLVLGNVAIIGFSTDQHISKWADMEATVNTQGTLAGLRALRSLAHKIPFNAVVLGGDYITGGSAQSIQTEIAMVFEQLAGATCPVVGTTGNHDSWQNDNTITDGDIFKTHTANAVTNYHRFVNLNTISANGYIDDPAASLRYIILDAEPRADGSTNLTSTITANLTAMLNGMPSGYKAVIFSHKPLNNSLGSGFKDAVDNKPVLEANASKIICCVNGHGHLDASATSNGVLYIQTTCAGIDRPNDTYDRTAGTANETVFDVFVIDQTNRKIYAVRYGAGHNREFTY